MLHALNRSGQRCTHIKAISMVLLFIENSLLLSQDIMVLVVSSHHYVHKINITGSTAYLESL